jgi:phosphoribosylformimino-5-aminoimidazole carboxamide ribotide isomerase
MLVPAMDLMGGKVVQLEQGKKKVLEYADPEPWIERFSSFPLVHLIDLDAAMQNGDNRALVQMLVKRLPCQVGGGVRTVETARELLECGARAVILGSALVRDGKPNTNLAGELALEVGREQLIFAVDAKQGKVATDGWRSSTPLTPLAMMQALEAWCGAFLYTRVDGEGLMGGMPLEPVRQLRSATSRRLFVAGGIRSDREVAELNALRVDAVVGMALYQGRLGSVAIPGVWSGRKVES